MGEERGVDEKVNETRFTSEKPPLLPKKVKKKRHASQPPTSTAAHVNGLIDKTPKESFSRNGSAKRPSKKKPKVDSEIKETAPKDGFNRRASVTSSNGTANGSTHYALKNEVTSKNGSAREKPRRSGSKKDVPRELTKSKSSDKLLASVKRTKNTPNHSNSSSKNGTPNKPRSRLQGASLNDLRKDDSEPEPEGQVLAENSLHQSASMPKLPRDENPDEQELPTSAQPSQQQPKKVKEVDKRVLETFNRVFAGHFTDVPAPLSKLVRVFTSSTFTDTMVERNALMEEVYPALKRYCREAHGLDFQEPLPVMQPLQLGPSITSSGDSLRNKDTIKMR